MQRVPRLEPTEIPEHADLWRFSEEIYGFLPNSLLTMGRDPELLEVAGRALPNVIMHRPGKTTKELRWLVAHVASRAAGCRYCSAHSGHFAGHIAGVSPNKLDAVWEFEDSPLFDEAEHAALRVALGGGQSPCGVNDEQMAALRSHYDDDAVIEIVAVICLFGFFNRWNDIMFTELESGPRAFADQSLQGLGRADQ